MLALIKTLCVRNSLYLAVMILSFSIAQAQTQTDKPSPAGNAAASADSSVENFMKSTKILLSQMGLKVVSMNAGTITFVSNGDNYLTFQSDDGTVIYTSTWWTIPKAKFKSIPYESLLRWNDIHNTYFSLGARDDGDYNVTVQSYVPAQNFDASILRAQLDDLEFAVQKNVDLLDASKWK